MSKTHTFPKLDSNTHAALVRAVSVHGRARICELTQLSSTVIRRAIENSGIQGSSVRSIGAALQHLEDEQKRLPAPREETTTIKLANDKIDSLFRKALGGNKAARELVLELLAATEEVV